MAKSYACWLTAAALAIGASAGLHMLGRSESTVPESANPAPLDTVLAPVQSLRSESVQLLAPSDDNVGQRIRESKFTSTPEAPASVSIAPPATAVKYASASRAELELALRETRVRFEVRTKSVIADRRARGETREVTAGPDGAFPTGNDDWPGGVKPLAGSIRGSSRRPGVAHMVQLLPGEDVESDDLAAEIDWLQQRLHALDASGG